MPPWATLVHSAANEPARVMSPDAQVPMQDEDERLGCKAMGAPQLGITASASAPKGLHKGKGRGNGKAQGKGKGRVRKTLEPCPDCPEPRYNGFRWRKTHKRAYEAMSYQAEQADKDHPGSLDAFTEAMSKDSSAKAKAKIERWSEVNPPDARYCRKRLIGSIREAARAADVPHRQEQVRADVGG